MCQWWCRECSSWWGDGTPQRGWSWQLPYGVDNNGIKRLCCKVVHCILLMFCNVFFFGGGGAPGTYWHVIIPMKSTCFHCIMCTCNEAITPKTFSAFNNHGISTENDTNLHRLWISGTLQHHSCSYAKYLQKCKQVLWSWWPREYQRGLREAQPQKQRVKKTLDKGEDGDYHRWPPI